MGLRDIGASLPPGFRFYPSDEELVCHYLYKKITNQQLLKGTLVEIDLHICEPWQLPKVAKLNANEWYFFSFRDRKYATGFRTNRATTSGYWKATGKDRTVQDPLTQEVVGMRKTLVFYRNRAPNGIKTGWIMHEFRLETPHMPPKEDWVLCRVFHKSKEENSGKLIMYDSISTHHESSNSMALVSTHHLNPINNHNAMNNFLHHFSSSRDDSQTNNANNNNNNSPKGYDGYGFIWDHMDLEDHSVPSSDFQVDNNNNNNNIALL
ncbi:protein CUP-SHAPED COTYLEDON 3-like [Arachis duranensis]|uniref:Protein CUP-SHAPED COTYLEDON 3-like n=1 Tax=Arachis duranensis TaxID=130453 RepID=A0A6P4DLX5_ARADU|nr:protein CUP-SHAPED COTYLEDON 3-like [Arachis duranensis]